MMALPGHGAEKTNQGLRVLIGVFTLLIHNKDPYNDLGYEP